MKKAFLGFTVLALAAMVGVPALASYNYGGGNYGGGNYGGGDDEGTSIEVENTKTAIVMNSVWVKADTGDNEAEGDDGGDGGAGGSADLNDNSDGSQTNTGGDGGNGGAGGDGGNITTGDALAIALIENIVNTNETYIEPCDCDDDDMVCEDACSSVGGPCGPGYPYYDPCPCPLEIEVENEDYAEVGNEVGVKADTGDNEADGDDGGDAGEGGSADLNLNDDEDGDNCGGPCGGWGWNNNGDDQTNTGGDGGNGGAGGDGGNITTGDASSQASILNMINTIITRIRY